MSTKRTVGFAVKLLFVVAAFTVIFRPQTFNLPEDLFQGITPWSLVEVLREVDTATAAFWFSFAVLMKLAGIGCGILRWRMLLRGQGLSIPLWYLAKCWFFGRAVGLFLPSTLGLDGYRLVESARHTGEVIKCTTVIAVEKLTGFIALFVLVFLTLPLGVRLLDINLVLLAVVLLALAGFIAVALLLLMNPRVVQVLVAVLPAPRFLRAKVDKLALAITAYGGRRVELLAAVALGFGVHLGICLMYFGAASAIGAPHLTLTDILFASPVVIVGAIIAPTVSGAGVREFGFGFLLGAKSGAAPAVMAGHLGLWAGEIVPFVLSLPLLLFTTRPSRERIEAELDQVRDALSHQDSPAALLAPDAVRAYRVRILELLIAAVLAGITAGALTGGAEALWVVRTLVGLDEAAALWWGPLVYGLLFAGAGAGLAAALLLPCLAVDRLPKGPAAYAACLGLLGAAAALVLGRFRFQRDVLSGHAVTLTQNLLLLAAAIGIGLLLAIVAWIALRRVRRRRTAVVAAGLGVYAVCIAAGCAVAWVSGTDHDGDIAFTPPDARPGPDIHLIVADALRADALPLFNPDAAAATPNLARFAQDAIVFNHAFSQASWTKPSFASLFTSRYPESHAATTKVSMLSDELDTFAEALSDSGYYTQGYANNPNITSVYNFNQGFHGYVDLKPDLYLGATPSAARLSFYEVLRRVILRVVGPLTGRGMRVGDFYQPAESVTRHALAWIDGPDRPQDAAFLLFLHYMDPHDPFMDWQRPGVGYARAQLGDPDPDPYRDLMRDAYDQEIAHFDEHVGAYLDALRERGLYDDALIIITADHGEEFYDHQGWWHGQTLYDEVLHVPMIIKLPGGMLGGAVNESFARLIDLPVTMLSWAGAPVPEDMAGRTLVGPDGRFGNAETAFVYAENDFENNVLQAVRTFDAKLIHANPDNPRHTPPVAFFDLLVDDAEQENRTGGGDPREIDLERVMTEMQAFIEDRAAEPVLMEGIPDELREQLEAIGYGG